VAAEHPSGNAALIYFQRSKWNTADRVEFLINLAVASKVAWDWQLSREPERGPTARPSALYVNDCPLWLRIGAPASEGRGEGAWWTITTGMRLAPLATSVTEALRDRAVSLLRDHLTDAALCRWLEAHDPQLGWPPESWRLLYLSVLLAAQGPSSRLDQVLAQLQDRAVHDPEDRLMVAASSRLLAHALLAAGRHDKAQQIAVTALTTLEPELGHAVPAHLSIYGALLQTSAVVAARRGDRAGATGFLTEAGVIAHRLGADRNDFWTVFGPTNVGIHRASVAVELGDAGRAVEQARAIDPSQLPSLERRAHHLLDLAQGYGQGRKDHQALDALLHAERLAPQEVHQQPTVQRLVVELLQRERRTTKPRLRELATRVGVLAA
jgi:tetratricopeptide (TPR) repeat protein